MLNHIWIRHSTSFVKSQDFEHNVQSSGSGENLSRQPHFTTQSILLFDDSFFDKNHFSRFIVRSLYFQLKLVDKNRHKHEDTRKKGEECCNLLV